MYCIYPRKICVIVLWHSGWKFDCTLYLCTFSSLSYIISLCLYHRKKSLNVPCRYIALTVTLSPPYLASAVILFSPLYLPPFHTSHLVVLFTWTLVLLTTWKPSLLTCFFVLVARNFRKLVGSRRVGREVEALSLTISRTFGYSLNHYYCWTFFIFCLQHLKLSV